MKTLINIATVITYIGILLAILLLTLLVYHTTTKLDLLQVELRAGNRAFAVKSESHEMEIEWLRKEYELEVERQTEKHELELEKQKGKSIRNMEEAYWLSYYKMCLEFHKDEPNKVPACSSYVSIGYHTGVHRIDPPDSWDFAAIIGEQGVQ
jgi:hypothetical protein